MVKFLSSNPELAGWVVGILLTVISVLAGFVVKYFRDIIRKADRHSGAISRVNSNLIDFKNSHANAVNSIYTSQKEMWEEIAKLRGSVEEGNVVIGRRKEELDQLRDDTWRVKRKLAEHHGLHKQFFLSIRNRAKEGKILDSKLKQISQDLFIVKKFYKKKDDKDE